MQTVTCSLQVFTTQTPCYACRSEAKAASTHQASSKGQEGSPTNGETSRGQDPLEEHDSSARDDWECRGDPQWEGLQPGRD